MGLDVSHGAFSGAYSAFNRFRQVVAAAAGGSFPPHDDPALDHDKWYVGDHVSVETHPGLWEFMAHSDCDGEIAPDMCARVADDLEALLPKIEAIASPEAGHIARDGGFASVTRRFIEACRVAHARSEALKFH